MAGDAIVGVLRAILGLDAAQYEDGAKKAGQTTDSLAKKMAEFAGGIALEKHISKAVNALKHFATDAIDTADNLFKLSQKTGISVEQLSGLKHAAELSDVSVEGLARGFKNLSIELVKTQTGGVGPAASAFQLLGINIAKIKPGDTQEAFLQIADALKKFDRSGNDAALAAAFFGKKFGPELLPLLVQGRTAIEQTIESAKRLGLVISTETAAKAEIFNDRMKDLKSAVSGIALTALAPLADGLARITTSFVEFINRTNAVSVAATGLVRAIAFVVDNLKVLDQLMGFFLARLAIITVINFAGALVTMARAMATAVTAMSLANIASLVTTARFATLAAIVLFFTGNLPAFTEQLGKVGDKIAHMLPADTAKVLADGLDALGIKTGALKGELEGLGEAAVFVGPRLEGAQPKQIAPALDDTAKKAKLLREHLEQLRIQTLETQGSFDNFAPGIYQAAKQLKLVDESTGKLTDSTGKLLPGVQQLNSAMIALAGAKLTQEFLLPWEQYEKTMQRLNVLMAQEGVLSQETYARASVKAATDVMTAWGQTAQSIVGPMAEGFKAIASLNKKYAGIAKAAAIGEALVNTYLAATKAYASVPPPFNIAAAAAVTFAGLANVAKIKATEFSTGGSFKVGGVGGGIDSQLVQFKATPGEMVDVRRPGQTGGGSTEITVRGVGPDEIFTGRWLRGLVDALNMGERDGYRLQFAER